MYCSQFFRGRVIDSIPIYKNARKNGRIDPNPHHITRLGMYQQGTVAIHVHSEAPPELIKTDSGHPPYVVEECFPKMFPATETSRAKCVLCATISSYTSPTDRVLAHVSSVFSSKFKQQGRVIVLGGFKSLVEYRGPGQKIDEDSDDNSPANLISGDEVFGILYEGGKIRVIPTNPPTGIKHYDLTVSSGSLISTPVYEDE